MRADLLRGGGMRRDVQCILEFFCFPHYPCVPFMDICIRLSMFVVAGLFSVFTLGCEKDPDFWRIEEAFRDFGEDGVTIGITVINDIEDVVACSYYELGQAKPGEGRILAGFPRINPAGREQIPVAFQRGADGRYFSWVVLDRLDLGTQFQRSYLTTSILLFENTRQIRCSQIQQWEEAEHRAYSTTLRTFPDPTQ